MKNPQTLDVPRVQRVDGADLALVGAECEQPFLLRVPCHGSDLRIVQKEVVINTKNCTVSIWENIN